MLQFITALEKTSETSHYTGHNRFDSFAPIRLNVAAQWLVDGVSAFLCKRRRKTRGLAIVCPCPMVLNPVYSREITSGTSRVRFS